jgi:hypothetical protein
MKYVIAVIGFLVVSVVMAFACGLIMETLLPAEYPIPGVGIDWKFLPGIVIGLLGGAQSWQASLRVVQKRHTRKRDGAP